MSMDQKTGIIMKITGGFYYVEAAESVYECKARGVFRKRVSMSGVILWCVPRWRIWII